MIWTFIITPWKLGMCLEHRFKVGQFFKENCYKDRKQVYYYSRGSLLKTKTWSMKSFTRSLISKEEFDTIGEKLRILHLKLNGYIKKLTGSIESYLSLSNI